MGKRTFNLEFDKLKNKIKARKDLVDFFREFTGSVSINPEKQYWTLCNKQSKEDGSEINQLVRLGLITPNQYYGIDLSKKNIMLSQKNHPEANFFCGEWTRVIQKNRAIFNPEIVYLDTTHVGNSKSAADITRFTMTCCPPGTFLFVNVMLNNPHNGKGILAEDFTLNLRNTLNPSIANLWEDFGSSISQGKCLFYKYNATGLTKMGTYIFRRKNNELL